MIIIITAGKNYDKNMQLGYVYMVYAGSPRAIYSPVKSTGILLGRIASNDRLVVVFFFFFLKTFYLFNGYTIFGLKVLRLRHK